MKYADFRPNLDIHPLTGDLLMFVDNKSIESQLKNIVMIDFYELHWKPTVGAGVPQTLFDNFGANTQSQLETRIRENINKYVKRAKLMDVRINYDNNNGYSATIIYQPVNQLEPITLNILLARIR